MTDEQINVAIAEACGLQVQDVPFTPALASREKYYTTEAFAVYRKVYPSGMIPMKVPSYTTDLNAMHGAVGCQTYSFKSDFNCELMNLCERRGILFCELTAKEWVTSFLTVKRIGVK